VPPVGEALLMLNVPETAAAVVIATLPEVTEDAPHVTITW